MTKENSIFGGTTFWMLNDKLEDEDIVYQIRQMHDKGIYAFIARTYIGLKSDYPGEGFMSKIQLMINTAKECGMRLYLQARYMPEAIPDLEPQNALDFLVAQREPLEDNVELLHSKDGINYGRFCSGTFLNMFDEDAIDRYIEICYGMWDRFKEHFGKTVMSVWVDEPSYSAEYLPYPNNLEAEFKKRYGYDLRDKLHLLYLDEEGYGSVRWQYRTLLQDLMEKAYFAKIRKWCDANNLWFSGHLMMEETINSQLMRAAATMPFYSYFNLPGIDVLLGQLNWREGEIKPPEIDQFHGSRTVTLSTPLQLASAAAQAGQEHMLCEMYGCSSQNLGFRDQKHIFDTYACYGINHRAIHGSFYSLRGRRKRAYPPHVNYYQPYWGDYRKLNDAISVTSQFVTEGKRSAKVLVIHPMGSGSALFPGKIVGQQKAESDKILERLDNSFISLLSAFTAAHIQFDLGDERIIERDGKVDKDKIWVGNCCYDTVVMPNLTHVRRSVVDIFEKYAASGGKLITIGNLPKYADGNEFDFNCDALRFENLSKTVDHLKAQNEVTVSGVGACNIRLMKRDTRKGFNCFVFNFDCSTANDVTLAAKGQYKAFITDNLSGKRHEIYSYQADGQTLVDLTAEAGGSIMLTFEEGCCSVEAESPRAVVELPLKNKWQIERKNENVMLLEFCRYKKADGQYSINMPILAVQDVLVAENYVGRLTLEFEFESLIEVEGAKLAIEELDFEGIYFNGNSVATDFDGYYLAKQFKTLPLPKILKGINKLTVVIAEYTPLARAKKSINSLFENQKGDELESCYIIGDFAVKADSEPCLTGNVRYSGFALDNESDFALSEVTAGGYPFYAGKLDMSQHVNLNKAKRVLIEFDCINSACADVTVNGKHCGTLMWAPYLCDITDAVKDGDNEIIVTISSTLRNLLGPYHRPHGEIGNLFGGSYDNPNLAWNGTDKQISDPKWYEHRVPDTPRWCESYMQTKLGIVGGKIIIE